MGVRLELFVDGALVELHQPGLEGVADMLASGVVGRAGVALADGGDDFGVFVNRLVGAAFGGEGGGAEKGEGLGQGVG